MIQVRLFATFRKNRFKERQMPCPEGFCVGDLLQNLDISVDEVGILLVNGRNQKIDHGLKTNDVVSIFPAVGGG